MSLSLRSRPVVREKKDRTTYYISPNNGSDSNNGKSKTSAWATYNKAYSVFENKRIKPGDKILLDGSGLELNAQIYFPLDLVKNHSQTPVTFDSYRGKATVKVSNNNGSGFYIYKTPLVVKNLTVIGSGYPTSSGTGIYFYSDTFTGAYIKNCKVYNCRVEEFKEGIIIGSDIDNEKYINFLISSCILSRLRVSGISSFGIPKNLHTGLIRYCTITLIYGDLTAQFGAGNAVVLGSCLNTIIEYCKADNAGALEVNTANLFWFYNSDFCDIRYCDARNMTRAAGADGGAFGIDLDSNNCKVYNNFAYNCDGAGVLLMDTKNTEIFGNVFVNCDKEGGLGAVCMFGGNSASPDKSSLDVKIYNNTFVYDSSISSPEGVPSLIQSEKAGSTAKIFNNLFITSGSNINLVESLFSNNLVEFYGNSYKANSPKFNWNNVVYSSLSAWRTATGKEILNSANTGFEINPSVQLLVNSTGNNFNSFKLLNPSEIGSRGLNLSNFGVAFPTDLFGNSVNQITPNIGADQSLVVQSALTPLPTIATANYVATSLPNVPSARREAVANAANSAANGTTYTGQSVIDLLKTASNWWSFDLLSCFQDSAGTTPIASIGDRIGRINPWVGTLSASQTGTTTRPTFTANGAGFSRAESRCLTFDGSGFVNQRYTVFAVSSRTSGQENNVIFGGTSMQNNQNLHLGWALNNGFRLGQYGSDVTQTVANYTTQVQSIVSGRNSATNRIVRINRAQGSANLTTLLSSNIGAALGRITVNSVNQFFSGTVSEVIFFYSALSDADIEKVERFLNFYRSLTIYT